MTIDIICPLYNAENDIADLHKSLLMQKNVTINKIMYILTECKDNTEKILNELHIPYEKIKKEEFSHSLTREKAALKSEADIFLLIAEEASEKKNALNPIFSISSLLTTFDSLG